MNQGIPFTKMHGLGNDYVYINCFQHPVKNPEALSPIVSDRHFGIGADGLVLIEPADDADVRMRMFNADGSEAQMCGNAIRCVGRYCYERNLVHKQEILVATGAGLLALDLSIDEHNIVTSVKVNMGVPAFTNLPIANHPGEMIMHPIDVNGTEVLISCASMGNPHAVIFVDKITDTHVLELGPQIERHPIFPERINVEFVEVHSREEVSMRVWERGSGETLACGTGAAAVAAICVKTDKTDRELCVHLRGGDLQLTYDESGAMYKEGPASYVFEGTLFGTEEELIRSGLNK